ncbi:PaaX family transcriptional regulator [Brevibacterium sanguinis]|uniref:PaaX family transcriptional regulator n=2 Tax=Brevibacterium TaxID=1696 RepID=A0A366IJV0_9MICO|nr:MULTISPECIES: PaaX family transcriptional regulator C-terminal domain-containing protein [Brevibacterium]RBP66063.1 PaaX family transcriptional regulator [Brevibacterium sanguinis]RBP72714.1 PaaX family transcriptional regulator [Brevibacterium celere]
MTVHPQSLFLSLAGQHLLDVQHPLSGASIVEVMSELGVGASAARSVLHRMGVKGLIDRTKLGRRTYYSLSKRGRSILAEGREKMFKGGGGDGWDGTWTLVRVQVPEAKRALRHRVSTRLSWCGYGQLDGSTWVAPGRHAFLESLGDLGDELAPVVLVGRPQPPTTDEQLVAAFDIDDLAKAYQRFGEKWDGLDTTVLTPRQSLIARVELHHDWLTLTRTDPQLPMALLPQGWPGTTQERLFRALDGRLTEAESSVLDAFFAGELPADEDSAGV